MKIAIIGSREFKQLRLAEEILVSKLRYYDVEVITGGAKGIDELAEKVCKSMNMDIDVEIIRPVNPSDKFSYLLRNVEIITKADKIIAFWDGQSKGTKFVIDYARARNKDIEVIMDNGNNQ